MKTRMLAMMGLIVALGLPMAAQATLMGILPTTAGGTDYQAYYDTSANLTWLTDANAAKGSSYTSDGTMNWSTAISWANSVSITGYVGTTQTSVGSWGLPTTTQPDSSCSHQTSSGLGYGDNCTGSEMGDLFYNTLGNTSGSLTKTGPFSNVQSGYYWSATALSANGPNAWGFNFKNGAQNGIPKTHGLYAWAVLPGNPGDPVPAPGSLWLMGAGLTLLGLMLGRRRLPRH